MYIIRESRITLDIKHRVFTNVNERPGCSLQSVECKTKRQSTTSPEELVQGHPLADTGHWPRACWVEVRVLFHLTGMECEWLALNSLLNQLHPEFPLL